MFQKGCNKTDCPFKDVVKLNKPIMEKSVDISRSPVGSLEQAAQQIEKCLTKDNSAPTLSELMNIHQLSPEATASGLTDLDYPILSGIGLTSVNLTQVKTLCKVPLPTEIMEHFGHMQCHCMIGLFPEVDRAWLTIDSDVYLWTYEKGNDVAYYDGLNDTIISVGLVPPKPGVFHAFIKHLLVLTTAVDIIVLGVTFTGNDDNPTAEIQLVPDPVFSVPTDGSVITTIAGTSCGRLFLGSKEGYLYEISYQAESSWFGKRFKKINHSTSALSFLVPSFLNAALSDLNGIVQISIDNSRNILYTLNEKGTIEVYDMGVNRTSFSRVAKLNQPQLVQMAMRIMKTLDSQNFRPLVNISAVELEESSQINLVAVSQSGIRFYLTTMSLSNVQPMIRPYCLTLLHVRLPPGFSANMTTRPRNVHISHYKGRNLILLCSVTENDTLWCISSDLFPFSSSLTEVHTTVSLDGPALAMAEVPYNKPKNRPLPDPPTIVVQHIEPPKKYVVLTSQGAHVFLKLRPVDLLRQILIESRGLDTDVIKNFFTVQQMDQACATSLILACLEDPQNADVAEYATRAFFLFGGEPRLTPISMGHQQNILSGSSLFMPNVMSTPGPYNVQNIQNPNVTYPPFSTQYQNVTMSPNTTQFELSPFQYSSKHNGLYIYLGRILRSIWNNMCVEKFPAQNKKIYLTSSITATDCILTLSHLNSLRNFVLKNSQLSIYNQTTSRNVATDQSINTGNASQNYTINDAQIDEKHSLDAFKAFISHCCQVMGLWKILCEHQFHILADGLPEQQKQMLLNTSFKDLLLFGKELCSMFITTLINNYLGDNASVDSISSKLRDVCPDLYKMEDATISKANEILKSARGLQNLDEKEDLILSAFELCKSVAPDINLGDICHQFITLKAYNAVIELCVLCANKVDPKNVAAHFYKNSEQGDQEGYRYYTRRMEVYQQVLNMLNSIYVPQDSVNQTLANTSGIQNVTAQDEAHILVHRIIDEILQYPDELLHVAIYEWMISKNMSSDIINVKNSSLETYLQKVAQESPNNINVLDLLWKYYESNNNHTSAAKILNNLASKLGTLLTLQDRMSYLARAVMCMRSDKVGYAPYLGVFLRELEDKIDIAKVQEQILEAINNQRNSIPNAEDAIIALNSSLYEITQLYENFAEPFHLWECKLAIIDCAGYSDQKLVEQIWKHIIEGELQKQTGSGNDKMMRILSKVKLLARQYRLSSNCFPLQYLILQLEKISSQLKADVALVVNMFLSIDIPIDMVMNIYNQLIILTVGDRFWASEENEFHFFHVMAVLMSTFLRMHENFNNVEKRKIIALCQDTTATILSNLYSKPNTEALINQLRGIQAQLSRL